MPAPRLPRPSKTSTNSYPLVADRFATARVYGHAAACESTWTARLIGERDGEELEGSPLAPQNPRLAADSDLSVTPDQPQRDSTAHSLQFDIPPSWTEPGDLTLRVDGIGGALDCRDQAGPGGAHPDAYLGSNEVAASTSVDITVGTGQDLPPLIQRIGGTTRAGTAAALAVDAFEPDDISGVIIASGEDFPDALAVGGPATQVGEPLLLTGRDGLPPETIAALDYLQPFTITIAVGPSAVSPAVEAQLAEMSFSVFRVEGSNRFETAAAIAEQFGRLSPEVLYLATGRQFPDALAAAAAAGVLNGKVVLTEPDVLPPATRQVLADIAPEQLTVLGGINAVSEAVEAEAASLTGGEVSRREGPDRITTAIEVSRDLPGGELLYLATADDFPDGLTAGAIAGAAGAPVLLTPADRLPPEVLTRIIELDPLGIVIVGGDAAISSDIEEALRAGLQ